MHLIIALLILAVWGIYGIIQALTPPAPIVKDWDKLLTDAIAKGAHGNEITRMIRSGKY